jgi:F-type H+-transporting ATPase subunit c
MIKRLAWMGALLSVVFGLLLIAPLAAMAQAQSAPGISLKAGLIALAANLGVGVAAMGCGLGQGRLVASAMESIGRNPNSAGTLFTPMIIGLAFIESLTLYALVIAFLLMARM